MSTINRPTHPYPIEPPNYEAVVDDLCDILEEGSECSDNTSVHIFQWGKEVLKIAREHTCDSVQEITKLAEEKIEELQKILVNPLNGKPLQDPVVERLWTWERFMHTECRGLFFESPLDGGPMSEKPLPHEFAKNMMNWMVKLDPSRGPTIETSSDGQLIPVGLSSRNPKLAIIRRVVYQRLAHDAVVGESQRQFQETIKEAQIRMDQFMDEQQKVSFRRIKEAEAKAAAHEEELRQKIDERNKLHQKVKDDLEGQIASKRVTYQAKASELENLMASMDKKNVEKLAALKSDRVKMDLEYQKEVANLQNEIKSQEKERDQTVAKLEAQIAADAKAHEKELASLTCEHSKKVSELEAKLKVSFDQISLIKASLESEGKKNMNDESRIQHLRSALNEARAEIGRLRRESKKSSCIIS